ncbi:Contactin-associated protein-like 2 [Cricetulus griseus]|uniref:Contactin-associated protein-like 2 n=1 Tax=Cricetulus griseus TaxID=10029 RepID=G3GXF7_CRIGR|nr:Contactin-associated protein-like 2 [Cricetulus griseus]
MCPLGWNCPVKPGGIIGSGLNDGQWHEVRFLAKENFAVLTIDGDEASAVRTNSPLQVKTGEKYFFGGRNTMV